MLSAIPSVDEKALVLQARAGKFPVVAKPPRYSATTIQNFLDCKRKFYWPTLVGLESPPSAAQEFGTKLHSYAERWLKHSLVPPTHDEAGRLANLALPILPKPQTQGLEVEKAFTISLASDLPAVTGTKDFALKPSAKDAPSFLLGDHKTSRSKRWQRDKEWLQTNVQANLYAYAEWQALKAQGYTAINVVDKQWIYYYREEKQAERLRSVDSIYDVAQKVEAQIIPAVREMAELVKIGPKLTDVPTPDSSVCDAYGGCPHRQRCFGYGLVSEKMGVLAGKFSKEAIEQKKASMTSVVVTAINPPPAEPWTAPVAAPTSTPVVVQAAVPEVDTAEVKRPRGRPRKEPQVVATTVAPVQAQEQVVEFDHEATPKVVSKPQAPAPFKKSAAMPGANPEHNYWLLLGTKVTKGATFQPTHIDELLGEAQIAANAMTDKEHFRLEFGGHSLLIAAFDRWLEENPLKGAIAVDVANMSPGARDVIGSLRAHATMVFEA